MTGSLDADDAPTTLPTMTPELERFMELATAYEHAVANPDPLATATARYISEAVACKMLANYAVEYLNDLADKIRASGGEL